MNTKHVGVVVPGATPDHPSLRGFIPAPFPDIPGHVRGSVRRYARKASHRDWAFALEIAERSKHSKTSELWPLNHRSPFPPRQAPMCSSRQTLPGEFCISCRLVPANPRNRIVILTLRVIAGLPCGRARLAGLVYEIPDRRIPRQLPPVLEKPVLPERPVPIPSALNEFLVLFVGDFLTVYVEIVQLPRVRFRARNPHHGRGNISFLVQPSPEFIGNDHSLFSEI